MFLAVVRHRVPMRHDLYLNVNDVETSGHIGRSWSSCKNKISTISKISKISKVSE
jgi:hypothetical protein